MNEADAGNNNIDEESNAAGAACAASAIEAINATNTTGATIATSAACAISGATNITGTREASKVGTGNGQNTNDISGSNIGIKIYYL